MFKHLESILIKSFDLTILFLWIMAGSIFTAGLSNGQSMECPNGQTGFYVDPYNCSRYYECIMGQAASVFNCPATLYWRVVGNGMGYCDLPDNPARPCNQSNPLEPSNDIQPLPAFASTTRSMVVVAFQCPARPFNRTSANGFYVNPNACNQFFLCIDGMSYPFQCPSGMYFSDSKLYCDWERRVTCSGSRPGSTGSSAKLNGRGASVGLGMVASMTLYGLLNSGIFLRV